jgi:uncharacterized repeat protein (TIGR03803 family)
LTNIGSNSLNWAATSATPWLSVFPISGAISTNGSGQLVTLSLNSAASSLPPASYTASVWFTNLSDGFAQSRQLLLNVSIASTLPVIVSQPQSRTAPPGASVSFTVGAVGSAPLSYQWQKNSTNLADGGNIFGSTNTTLSVNNVSAADAGTYSVIVSNSLNRASSAGAVLTVASLTSPGVAFSTLYSFTGAGDGGVPNGLMQATNGDFYGTTQNGGASNAGTIFQMAPSGAVGTLYAFGIGDGPATPSSALAQGPDGLLYGVSTDGGANAWGTIYKTTTNGIVTNVVSFDLGLGVDPDQTLTLGVDGNFYGTTPSAGSGDGNVFCLATNGALTFLATFDETNGLLANQLTQGADGSLYGTTFEGGGTGNGAIFNLTTNGLFTSLYSFSETNGGFLPEAGLAQTPDGTFYGTTFEGGVYGYGTVFAMTPLGEVTTVYSFTGGSDGGHPAANLILAGDGNFYGTTANGGAYDDGTVFKMAPGNAPVTLATFDGYNGANPQSPLVQGTDGNFYGTTPNGGADGNGVIFRVNINSPSLQITGQPPDQTAFLGANAVFSVAVAGNPPIFYQWRKNGANLTDGLNISGSSTRVLTVSNVSDFDAAFYSVIVSNASGSAVSSNAFLEVIASPPQIVRPPVSQTVSVGGSATFAVTAVGDLPLSYQWQLNSTNMTNGANVFGAETSCLTITNLTQLSNGVYSVIVRNEVATATASAVLTVYPVSVSGTVMWSLHWFTGGSDGGTPNGLAVGSNGLLYGTTQSGGVSGGGTIFSITTNGVFNTLVSFGATNGANPEAALTQAADGDLYGVSAGGGSFSDGTVFKMTPAGALTSLFSFSNKSSLNPYVALVQASNGSLYGATANGNRGGDGNIFEMATNGAPGVLYSFTGGLDGNEPIGALTQATDGNFYGMTTAGGSNGFGGIFRMTPGGMLTNIYCFTGGADGSNPFGALVQGTDGYLYGVTRRNIISNLAFYGEVFKVSTNGALTILHTNNPFVFGDGAHPFAGLLQATDGNFYGSTLYSEVTNFGTLFRITSTGVYTTLSSFNNSDDGSQPESAMVQGPDGALYGTTTYGGPYGKGTVFRMAFTSSPQITVQPVNQTNLPGAGALFTVAVVGAPPLGYQWQFNGTNLTDAPGVSGSASRVLMLNNIAPSNAGNYAVIITNALGSVSSSDALLVVESPPAFLSAVQADGGLMLTWSATPGAAYQVQSTSDLASLNWANVGSPVTAVNSTASAVMPASPASQQFYRVIMLP